MIDPTRSGEPRLVQTFAIRLGQNPDSKFVSVVADELWVNISGALEPIFGAGGVSALFSRSVFLSARLLPKLEAVPDTMHLSHQLDALRDCLSALDGDDATRVAMALVREFHGVLTSMVGTALTNQLLEPVLDPSTTETFPTSALR